MVACVTSEQRRRNALKLPPCPARVRARSCQLSFLGQSLTHLATLEHAALTVAASAPALPAPAPPGQDPALSTHRRALALLKQLVAAGSLGLPALTVKLRASLPPAQPGHGDDDGDGDEDARPDQPHLRQHQEPAHPHTAPVSEAARLIPAPWRAVLAAPLLLTDAVPPPSPSTWLTHLLTCASSSSSSTVAASASLAPGEVWGERAAKLRVLQQVRALRRWADGADAAARWLGPPPQVEVEGAPGRAAAALVCVALAELPAPLLPPALSELCNSPVSPLLPCGGAALGGDHVQARVREVRETSDRAVWLVVVVAARCGRVRRAGLCAWQRVGGLAAVQVHAGQRRGGAGGAAGPAGAPGGAGGAAPRGAAHRAVRAARGAAAAAAAPRRAARGAGAEEAAVRGAAAVQQRRRRRSD